MVNKYFKVILFIAFFVVAANMYAQGPPPPPIATPIGNGIIYLVISAVAFGVKKIWDKDK